MFAKNTSARKGILNYFSWKERDRRCKVSETRRKDSQKVVNIKVNLKKERVNIKFQLIEYQQCMRAAKKENTLTTAYRSG